MIIIKNTVNRGSCREPRKNGLRTGESFPYGLKDRVTQNSCLENRGLITVLQVF